jgi:sec-independent protein translocase protein TatA
MLMTPTIASILNFAGPDMMVILLIVLLLFGAKKLPELARGMGRAVKEFSAAPDEIGRESSVSPAPLDQRRQNYSTKQASGHPPPGNPGAAIRAMIERAR